MFLSNKSAGVYHYAILQCNSEIVEESDFMTRHITLHTLVMYIYVYNLGSLECRSVPLQLITYLTFAEIIPIS